jgi:HK97 family phage major capsid protein
VNVRSIIGRLTGLRRIPIKTRTLVSTAISSGWVGEGAAKALSNPTYTKAAGLDPFKIATVVVATDELLNSSDPAAETAIREQMIRDQVVAVDSAFIDPANAGVANVKPASILSGAGVGGSSPAGPPEGDLETLIENFTGSLEDAVIVMHPALAARLSGADRPLIGVKGGTWSGFPVITSSVVPGGIVAMIDPTGIAVAMPDNLAEIRVSTQGTIEMSDGPTSSAATPTATAQVSLWQVNSVAILAERVANWRVVRSGAVAYLSGASY